jgi:hypothetical protein
MMEDRSGWMDDLEAVERVMPNSVIFSDGN